MSSVVVVVGNPATNSRTRTVGIELGRRIADFTGAALTDVFDLAEVADELFHERSEQLSEVVSAVAAAEYVIFATPTYKASYSGVLKAFLDRFKAGDLSGVTAFAVFTLGSPAHTLAVEYTLKPLLSELGASAPTPGLAFLTSDFEQRAEVLDAWVEAHRWAIPIRERRKNEAE